MAERCTCGATQRDDGAERNEQASSESSESAWGSLIEVEDFPFEMLDSLRDIVGLHPIFQTCEEKRATEGKENGK